MLKSTQLSELRKGDLIETHPLFYGLSSEIVVLKVVDTGRNSVTATATWYGIMLGRWTARATGTEVSWSKS